ncbi:MAG: hypothetical protein MUF01_14750, partial [Bryobacterales bacterium]|nr:hypothetical protein [Bryobacterales bacterium]
EEYRTELEARCAESLRNMALELQAVLDAPQSTVPHSERWKAAANLTRIVRFLERDMRRVSRRGGRLGYPETPDAA